MNKKINSQTTAEVFKFEIPCVDVSARTRINGKKIEYLINDETPVKLIDYAVNYLTEDGWLVYKGDDAHFFFSIMSFNFKKSFFYAVCRGYVGRSFKKRVTLIEEMVKQSLDNNKLDPQLHEEARDLLLNYYSEYSPKSNIHYEISEMIPSFDEDIIIRILRFYRNAGYTTAGIPDIFAVKGSSFSFIKVKSNSGELNPAQFLFFKGYLTTVGDNIFVLKVFPTN